jgi:hypothetical protein
VAAPGDSAAEVATGINHATCARLLDNRIACWGNNSAGQVGDGTSVDRPTPTLVAFAPDAGVPVPASSGRTTLGLAGALLVIAAANVALSRNRRKTVTTGGGR